ncbi:MAG: hypothetical protein ABIS67_12695 [Candidatus Eisenbacteria bacterium]
MGPLLVLAAGLIVFRGALRYFFSADDFAWLAQAQGSIEPVQTFSRWIPYRLFWKLWLNAFGLEPLAYHLASLAAFLASSIALFLLLRRRVGIAAAAVGAAFFATHPAHFDAVYWISAIGDPLAVGFALLALRLCTADGSRRWWAVPAFAVALFCKESVAAFPLAGMALQPAARGGWRRAWRDPVLAAMLALSAVTAVAYLTSDVSGLRSGDSTAYAVSLGPHLGANLLTYAGWSLNFLLPTVRSFGDAVDPGVFGWGAAALVAGLTGLGVPALRRRAWPGGVALFAAGLLPVLPLERHTYHYYLMPALAGAAMCVAAGFDALEPRMRRGLSPAVALALAGLLTANGFALVRKIEHHPFAIEGLRANPVVDRALISQRALESLGETPIPPGTTMVFWSPTSRALEDLRDERRWSYGERNVRAALYDGLGVRVFYPALREVRFTTKFEPATDSVWYAVYRADGSLRVAPAPELEEVLVEHEGGLTQ